MIRNKQARAAIDTSEVVSLALLAAIFIFFAIMSDGKLLSLYNLKSLVDQTLIYIIAGLGCLFVVAQGGTDLSLGTTVGITTVISTMVVMNTGLSEFIIFPVAIAVGLGQGLLTGFLVAKMKVPSFMVTLAFLIGMRGFMLFLQSFQSMYYFNGPVISALWQDRIKYPVLIILIVVFYFILTYSKFGNYCKAIGENESVAINVGLPVSRLKIYAFMLSALMAAVAGFFTLSKSGGTNNVMGQNLELDVLIGIFVGGVLVTGGYGTKITKLLIGCFTVSIIKVGLFSAGWTDTNTIQVTQGVVLVVILFIVIKLKEREGKRATALMKTAGDS
jgi:ribose transport system permease protein